MKRLFTLLTAMVCFLGIQAQGFYMVGDAVPCGWDAGRSVPFVQVDENVYEWVGNLTVGNEGFKILTSQNWGRDYHPNVNGAIIDGTAQEWSDIHWEGDDTKWKVSEDGVYRLVLVVTGEEDGHKTISLSCKPAILETELTQVEGVYQISNAAELVQYGALSGYINQNTKAVLTNDIDLTGEYANTMIGTQKLPFGGSLDGQGHTITIDMNLTNSQDGGDYLALFRYVLDCKLENLLVKGNIQTDKKFMGGLIGEMKGHSMILRNIVIDVNMNSTYSGDGTHGGIISVSQSETSPVVENIAFVGQLNAPQSEGTCGMVGYAHWGDRFHYLNSFVAGVLDIAGGQVVGRNGEYFNNNCYTTIADRRQVNDDDRAGVVIEAEEVANGALLERLNADGVCWYQNEGDAYPVPFELAAAPLVAAPGDYLLQNVATGLFLNGANDWGTRASQTKHGQLMTLAQMGEGKYTLDSHIANNATDHFLGSGGFVDSPETLLDVEVIEEGIVTIAFNGKYLAPNSNDTRLNFDASEPSEIAQWRLITPDDLLTSAAEATADAPVDMTGLIFDANFSRNNQYYNRWNWTFSTSNTNHNNSGANENFVCESYHAQFAVSQSLNVPNGTYGLAVQGFYRQDGSDNDHLPFFYANDAQQPIGIRTGTENNMAEASNAFLAGKYPNEPLYFTVTDGTLEVGISNLENANLWVIFDNFELTYYGADVTPNEIALKTIIDEYNAAKEVAEAALQAEMFEEDLTIAQNTYDEALIDDLGTATKEDLLTAIGEMNLTTALAERFATKYNNNIVATQRIADGNYELTSLIINPSFEKGNLTGWESEDGGKVANNGNFGAATGTWFVEKWVGAPGTLTNGNLSQLIEGLPNGTYKLTAQAQNVKQGAADATTVTSGFFLCGNDQQTEVSATGTTHETNDFAVEFTVKDGTAVIGTRIENCTGNWMSVDNFRLFFVPEPICSYIMLTSAEQEVELVEGGSYAEANSMRFLPLRDYQNVTVSISKMVWNEPNAEWGETEGHYTEEDVALETPVKGEKDIWTVDFVKQPQNFADGFDYRIKIRGFEGEMFDADWNLMPYDEQLLTIHGCGEQDAIEIAMGFAMTEVLGMDEETMTVKAEDFSGVAISYPENNLKEALGEQAAVAVFRVTEAYIMTMDANGELDMENPVASLSEPVVSESKEGIILFDEFRPEADTQYTVYIPQRCIQLIDPTIADEETSVLWCNAGPWDEISIMFATAPATSDFAGVVTTSLDDAVLTSPADLEGIVLTFEGANTVEVSEDAYFEIVDTWAYGNEVYYMWNPSANEAYGTNCAYTIEGNKLTLTGFFDAFALMEQIGGEGGATPYVKKLAAMKKAAEGETDAQVNMYGEGFIVDGVMMEEQIDLYFNVGVPGEEHTYVAAGDFNNWNGSDETTAMTANGDGTYSVTVSINAAGSHEYKVVADGDQWIGPDGVNNGGNYSFFVTEGGDVTFTYNPATGEVSVTGEFVATEPEYTPETICIAGSFNEWNAGSTPLTYDASDNTWNIELTLEAGTYEFKFTDGSWNNNWGTSTAAEFVVNELTRGGSNIVLSLNAKSKVGIVFVVDGQKNAKFSYATEEVEIETGIDGIDVAKLANGKYIRGNQLIIVKNGKVYNANGVQMK